MKKIKTTKNKSPNNPFESKNRSMLKSSGKVTSRNKEVHDPYRLEGNEYFDNIKRKQVVGKGKKGKSREKKMDKSKEKSAGQVKKNIDKYYF